MTIGAFLGGAADGYRRQREDNRQQQDSDRRKKEGEQQDAERKRADVEREVVNKIFKEEMAAGEKSLVENPIMANPVAGGIGSQASPAEPMMPSASGGIGAVVGGLESAMPPEANIAASGIGAAPQGRVAPVNEEAQFNNHYDTIGRVYKRLVAGGHFNKAAEVGKMRTEMSAEKLQKETGARNQAAGNLVGALGTGSDEYLLQSFTRMSDLVGGEAPQGVRRLPDGTFKITHGEGRSTIITAEQAQQTAVGMVDWKAALKFGQDADERNMEAARDKQNAKNQDATLAEAKRKALAEEAEKKRNPGGRSGTTSEIENMEYMVKFGIAKDRPDAWDKIRTGVTKGGETFIPNKFGGGGIIFNNDTGQVSSITKAGIETIMREATNKESNKATAKSGATVKVGDIVDGFKFKGGDPNNAGSWEKM